MDAEGLAATNRKLWTYRCSVGLFTRPAGLRKAPRCGLSLVKDLNR